MAAVADAEPADAAAAAAQPSGARKRRRVAFGSADQYEEMGRLGEGSFGAVVKARNSDTGQEVAIKHLPNATQSAVLREAFFLVDACASGGGNPFVVACQGVVLDPTTSDLSLVMEYVGPSLSDVLRHHRAARGPPLAEATVRAAMWQLLTGASKMHDDGKIVHRDVKPQNILVGDGHTVLKFCDFGLATYMSDPPPHAPVGTLWYQAPELLLEKDGYDSQIDTWALGCIMAEMINTGRPLFRGSDDEGQLCAIFSVLGVPDDSTWPWFSSTPFATKGVKELQDMQRGSLLREVFPDTQLSEEGFQVLSGLLTCNPEKRLTAAAALKHPWIAKVDALELPKKEGVASFLPKRRRIINALMCV
ncbi:hypothetical protein BS78_01G160300 [Paspalum vaginatum]|nr:hypothetical protein BS78_01G160300 [Paspalum vaginatum]